MKEFKLRIVFRNIYFFDLGDLTNASCFLKSLLKYPGSSLPYWEDPACLMIAAIWMHYLRFFICCTNLKNDMNRHISSAYKGKKVTRAFLQNTNWLSILNQYMKQRIQMWNLRQKFFFEWSHEKTCCISSCGKETALK